MTDQQPAFRVRVAKLRNIGKPRRDRTAVGFGFLGYLQNLLGQKPVVIGHFGCMYSILNMIAWPQEKLGKCVIVHDQDPIGVPKGKSLIDIFNGIAEPLVDDISRLFRMSVAGHVVDDQNEDRSPQSLDLRCGDLHVPAWVRDAIVNRIARDAGAGQGQDRGLIQGLKACAIVAPQLVEDPKAGSLRQRIDADQIFRGVIRAQQIAGVVENQDGLT